MKMPKQSFEDKIISWILFGIFYIIGWIIGTTYELIKRLIFYLIAKERAKPKAFETTNETRFSHTHVVAGSGHGKTQLLQSLFLEDLPKLQAGACSVVIVDSQGDMIRKILRLQALSPRQFSSLSDRLVLIDPTDVEYPPCLNLFDFGLERIGDYDMLEREKLLNGAVSLYEYVFGALLGAEMTSRQSVLFQYLASLLMVVPGATINTLLDFMKEPELIDEHLMKLDMGTRKFFTEEFSKSTYDTTRQQITNRLWGILANQTLAKMFSHPHNKVDLFTAMNKGNLILINVAKDLLKDKAEIFGKFMVALLNQATLERSAIPEGRRLPTYIYIDEAADYLDEKMEEMINQARKFKVGLTLAHQNLGQLSRSMQQTVMASTATKFVGGLSDQDARAFAPEFRCKPEQLQEMHKTDKWSYFAMFIRNEMQQPAILDVELGRLERMPKMTDTEYQEMIALNRTRYCDSVKEIEYEVTLSKQKVKAFDLEEPPTI